MFIQIERTPNPRTVKFLPGCAVASRPAAFGPLASESNPFLKEIFSLGRVEGILLGADFVSVTLSDAEGWNTDVIRNAVSDLVIEHISSLSEIAALAPENDETSGEGTERRIREILDTHVRPAVAADGGDIVFEEFADGVLTLSMKGACSGCPSSIATLRHGIQNLMRHFVPEVRDVRAAEAA